jgi:hypothetical protein
MPFIPQTPESLLARSDSKNPAATCCGLTANGRLCRRAVSKSAQSSPGQGSETFCWQHKDQYIHASPQALKSSTIRERTSVDSLADRLGLLEVEQRKQSRKLASDPEKDRRRKSERRRPQQRKQGSSLALLCCIGEVDHRKAPRPVKPRTHISDPISRIPNEALQRPKISRGPSSGELLSLIPSSISPQTTALLLAELAKPVSEFDEEGYIYVLANPRIPSVSTALGSSSIPPRAASDEPTDFRRAQFLRLDKRRQENHSPQDWTNTECPKASKSVDTPVRLQFISDPLLPLPSVSLIN